LPIIGKMLGHTQAGTTQRRRDRSDPSAHLASDPVAVAADATAQKIATALSSTP
jgi:hypothetical protein